MNSAPATVADHAERRRALDESQSFIVRAPAGSGKTRLLIQRYLALLSKVDEPEEIVAITFTRKAAAEMKKRVLDAFVAANNAAIEFDEETRALARAALARDSERDWQILANGSRLRMQTIDALNASITRQMPLLARFGAQPESIDDATALYHEAAANLLAQVNDASPIANDVATLLAHLDNNLADAQKLIANVLRSRDHWLRNLRHMHERETLEATLARVCAGAVARVAALFPIAENNETLELARIAWQNFSADGVDSRLSFLDSTPTFPNDDADALPAWLALAEFFLTKEGSWRRKVDKRSGFPTSTDRQEKVRLGAIKDRMHALLQRLAENDSGDSGGLATALQRLRSLPASAYSESQWHVLGAIVRLLPHATAALWSVFGRQGQCDFTEISQAASRALGDDDAPTDLALALDYRISHLLVDEFQDTSFAQFELLEKLTRGWSEDDGRTLFLVGDPMQSIYRFREAEVSLFTRAWRAGVGGVRLNPLTLNVNFRSEFGIVEWVNNTFSALMPGGQDLRSGAVPYSPSVAFATGADAMQANAVQVHAALLQKDAAVVDDAAAQPSADAEEASRVVSIIESAQRAKPEAAIAILVRTRGHLREIIPALNAANITYHAVDIDPLKDRPVVQDLLALTRALLHPADRIAWLAVLRAPWCGLTLADLVLLTRGALPVDGVLLPDARPVWELLNDAERVDSMSDDGRARVKKFCDALGPALQSRRRLPLRELVESTWLKLQGPAALVAENDLNDVAVLLDLLETEADAQACGGQLVDLDRLSARVAKLYAGNRNAFGANNIAPVQIMTIHKAKGLEFDTVIVPGLHRSPRHDDKKLIVWTEQTNPDTGQRELLLAPIRETGADEDGDTDAIYQYVVQQDREKQRQEIVRLLYVAATRAESRLHLLATVGVKAGDENSEALVSPHAESMLAVIWPALLPTLLQDAVRTPAPATGNVAALTRIVPMRIADTQPQPALADEVVLPPSADAARSSVEKQNVDFDWAGETARHIGSVVHALLQRIADEGIESWENDRVPTLKPAIAQDLARRGVASDELADATARATEALANALADDRGNWVLQSHAEARAEWRLTGLQNDALVNIAIDRSFVDEHNVRWIIDFKTGGHEGSDLNAFLDNEAKRYFAQLQTYAKIVSALSSDQMQKTIKLGLYFPMLRGWREWEYSPPQ